MTQTPPPGEESYLSYAKTNILQYSVDLYHNLAVMYITHSVRMETFQKPTKHDVPPHNASVN
jgi:hypothetical protein